MRKSKPVQSQPKNQKAFAENNCQQPAQQEKFKPDSETKLALVSSPPCVDPLILDFAKAHVGFEQSFCQALGHARDAGESLLKLHSKTGLKGVPLFVHVREQGEITVSDRSCYLYQRIASRWNELQILAGDELSEMTLTKAIKLLQEPKEKAKDKPKNKPLPPEGQQATEIASNASQNDPADAQPSSEKSATELAVSAIDDPKPVDYDPDQKTRSFVESLGTDQNARNTLTGLLRSMVYLVRSWKEKLKDEEVEAEECDKLLELTEELEKLLKEIKEELGQAVS